MKYQNFCLLASSLILCSCGSGNTASSNNNYSLDTFVIMPISSTVCASGQFFSPNSLKINTNSGNSTYCSPYIQQQTGESVLSTNVINNIVNYYYGSSYNLETSCPAIGYQSGIKFPESSQYSLDVQQIVNSAISCVNNAFTTSNTSNPIFVFDIDDTLTSGYEGSCQYGFGAYDSTLWNNAENSLAFIRTPNMSQLLNYAFTHNIDIAFVTGRTINKYAITESNLIAAYPEYQSQIESIFTKGNTRFVLPSEESWTIDSYKNYARQSLINQNYHIVLNVGDQYSDLNYIYPYSNQPYCSYKMPNFMYYIK